MNQPTREEFEEFKQEVKQEVRQLREQITEPIKITRLEIDSGSMHKRLDTVQEDVGVLKEEMKGARADIASLKATQSDHSAFFLEHGQRLKAIEAKQDAHTEVLGQLVNFSESYTKRFDHIDATMATKDDIADMATKDDIADMATKDDIAELKSLMMQLLQQKPPES